MLAREITGEATTPAKPRSPAELRVQSLKQQTQAAQQQVKRERASKQLKRARQAVAQANAAPVAEAIAGTREYEVVVEVDSHQCRTAVVADGQVQAWKIAQHLFGKSNVRSVR